MNLKKFSHAFKQNGLIGFFNILLGKLGFKFRLQTLIEKRIKIIQENLIKISNGLVQSGPYSNLKISTDMHWSDMDFSPKILGLYEKEVQDELIKWNCKNFINLGGAEGYHALGQLISNTKKKSYVFEQSLSSKKILQNNIKINNLENKVVLFDKADKDFIEILEAEKVDLLESCFLFDIEGAEYNLLNNKNLIKLKNSKLIIELHEDKKKQDEFLNNLKELFDIKIFQTKERDLSKFSFLENFSDIDRWLMVSENRPNVMRWVKLLPKV